MNRNKKMGNWLMIDLETMSTLPDAAILSIGACTFEIEKPDEINGTFYRTVSLQSNEQYNRHISADTLTWWLQQKPEALSALFEAPTNLKRALVDLRMWAQEQSPTITHVIANDPDFDCVILQSAYRATGEMWPWGFWCNRSMRTITELAIPDLDERQSLIGKFRSAGTHHRADDDAIAQAKVIQHCYQVLNMRAFA
jgi:inhibitor of KinA sporulation pathway (predicted exonuclease)